MLLECLTLFSGFFFKFKCLVSYAHYIQIYKESQGSLCRDLVQKRNFLFLQRKALLNKLHPKIPMLHSVWKILLRPLNTHCWQCASELRNLGNLPCDRQKIPCSSLFISCFKVKAFMAKFWFIWMQPPKILATLVLCNSFMGLLRVHPGKSRWESENCVLSCRQ